ncbi:MAG: phage integrase SAM-like domain-containing protein [Bacteroidales bacterium]|nr:phage integrase SAM-like domain-containing protein [Bacteroidales bacterium]
MSLDQISISNLSDAVTAKKSPNSVRYYTAMFKRLREYNGNDTITLQSITPEYIAGFADHMTRSGLTAASVRQMLKFFRASFKDVYGTQRRDQFRQTFGAIASANETETRLLTYQDVLTIADSTISGSTLLRKIRDIFMFCLYGGGLAFDDIKSRPELITSGREVTQQQAIANQFKITYGNGLAHTVTSLTYDEYAKGLSAIAHILNLPHQLTPRSAVHGWIAAARHLGISPDMIAAAAADQTAYTANIIIQSKFTDADINRIRADVANHIVDLTPHWYVMRCFALSPAETSTAIRDDANLCPDRQLDTFIAPTHRASSRRKARTSLIDSLLFFRCTSRRAMTISRATGTDAYIYTLSGTKTPAPISNVEMRTFMLLCDVAADTLDYHFPQRPDARPTVTIGSTATIMVGNLTGHVGIVSKISKDRYKVVIRFHTLGSALISAEIPVEFLKFD